MTHAVYVACLLENTIREGERERTRARAHARALARAREITAVLSGIIIYKNISQLKAAIFKVFVDEELREAQ